VLLELAIQRSECTEFPETAVHLPAKGASNEKEFLILTYSTYKNTTFR